MRRRVILEFELPDDDRRVKAFVGGVTGADAQRAEHVQGLIGWSCDLGRRVTVATTSEKKFEEIAFSD
jgi:hypothetical protein